MTTFYQGAIHLNRDGNGELALWTADGQNLLHSESALDRGTREENAVRLVTAWNAHDAMAKALADIAREITTARTCLIDLQLGDANDEDVAEVYDKILAIAAPHVPVGTRHKPDEVKLDYNAALAAQKGAAMPFEPLPPHLAAIGNAANDPAPFTVGAAATRLLEKQSERVGRDVSRYKFKVRAELVVEDLLSREWEIEARDADSAEAVARYAVDQGDKLEFEMELDNGSVIEFTVMNAEGEEVETDHVEVECEREELD